MKELRRWRARQGLSVEAAGALIGISGPSWHRYETGRRRLPAERVLDIERVTGISRHELRPDIFGSVSSSVNRISPASDDAAGDSAPAESASDEISATNSKEAAR